MDAVAKINDPQCEMLLVRACTGISKLYFAMRTCLPRVFESVQCSFDVALRSALERIVTTYGPGFSDWQWRLSTLPFAFGGLGIYSTGDVLNYAFFASRLQSAVFQTKLLRHVGIVAYGFTFDDALSVFNTSMEIDFLSNPCEIAAPKLMKIMTDIYFTRVIKDAISTFSLSSRQMALWKSQMEDHTSDWLRAVDFVPGRANDAVTLLKRIQKFSVTQDIGARTAIHIFNRTGFAIAKGVEAQIALGIWNEINIPEFDGKTLNPEGFIDWLVTVEEVFEFKEVPENKRVSLIATKLRGRASAWWQQLKLTRERVGKPRVTSWRKMKKLLRENFIPHNYQRLMYQRLQNLKQGTKSVEDYTIEFYQLIARNDIQETDDQLVSRYIGGLRVQIMDSYFNLRKWVVVYRDQSKGVGSSGLKCFNCGEPGHRQSECKKAGKRHLFVNDEWEDNGLADNDYEESPIITNSGAIPL
ncbi:reverse transcriptase domain-containing protein [Tanacetum coccineum]